MTDNNKWPEAKFALVFVRSVRGLSEEIQMRMVERAVRELGAEHAIYKSPITGDKNDERGELLKHCRGSEVVVVARLNVLGRPRKETGNRSASNEFIKFVGNLRRKCKYILVLDDNMSNTPVNTAVTSEDGESVWDAVVDRAADVVSNSRALSTEDAKKMNSKRWAGEFRGVVDEWTKNPERAEELEAMRNIWCNPFYPNAQAAYDAMPDSVRAQIKSLETARKIFKKRKPGNNVGRPKKD